MKPSAVLLVTVLAASPLVASAQESPSGANTGARVAGIVTEAVLTHDPADDASQAAGTSRLPKVEPAGFLSQPRFITRAVDFTGKWTHEPGRVGNGFYVDFSNMVTSSGWISAGPGYRHWIFGNRAIVDGSAALSWHAYKMAQGRLEFPELAQNRLSIGSQVLWQDATQINYFGRGPDSLEDNASEYRLKTTDVVGYATVRPVTWLAIGGRLGWLQRPSVLEPGGTFRSGDPSTRTLFPDDPVFARSEQPSYIHGDATITADTRDSHSHPSRGGMYRAVWTTYSDRDTGAFSFRRYEGEVAHFFPFSERRIVLAFHGWIVGSDTTDGRQVPFYLAPTLGGSSSVRSYTSFRFHDNNMATVTAESRFALITHIDLAAFVDAGNVASRFSGLSLAKHAYGVGLRMHTERATFARLDVAHGAEGWRILLRTNDPLRIARLARRTAAVPFAP